MQRNTYLGYLEAARMIAGQEDDLRKAKLSYLEEASKNIGRLIATINDRIRSVQEREMPWYWSALPHVAAVVAFVGVFVIDAIIKEARPGHHFQWYVAIPSGFAFWAVSIGMSFAGEALEKRHMIASLAAEKKRLEAIKASYLRKDRLD